MVIGFGEISWLPVSGKSAGYRFQGYRLVAIAVDCTEKARFRLAVGCTLISSRLHWTNDKVIGLGSD